MDFGRARVRQAHKLPSKRAEDVRLGAGLIAIGLAILFVVLGWNG